MSKQDHPVHVLYITLLSVSIIVMGIVLVPEVSNTNNQSHISLASFGEGLVSRVINIKYKKDGLASISLNNSNDTNVTPPHQPYITTGINQANTVMLSVNLNQ